MLPAGRRRLIAGLSGVVAAVLFVEVDPTKWYHEQTAVYSVDKNELFNYITSPGEVKEVRGTRVEKQELAITVSS